MFQMAGVGPMMGQANVFYRYAPEKIPYAIERYQRESLRLLGILDHRLADNEYVAGDFFSIADMSIWPWASLWEGQQQTLEDKPNLARWLETCQSRPGVQAGRALYAEKRGDFRKDQGAQSVLFKRD